MSDAMIGTGLLNSLPEAVFEQLMASDFSPRVMRPFCLSADEAKKRGVRPNQAFITNESGLAVPVHNATSLFTKEQWVAIDRRVIMAAVQRTPGVTSLISAGLTFDPGGGMANTVLQTQAQSDTTDAIVSMEPRVQSANDRPETDLDNFPLPFIHKDCNFGMRELAISRKNGGRGLDSTQMELNGRKIGEMSEQMFIGTGAYADYKKGGGTIYGITTYPDRHQMAITPPTAEGWTGETFINEVTNMMEASRNLYHYGPWNLYLSNNWDKYMDRDYSVTGGNNQNTTIRRRLLELEKLNEAISLDFMPKLDGATEIWTAVLVQMTPDVIRVVNPVGLTTVQWQTQGGLASHFKQMQIQQVQIRSDYYNRTGIVHAVSNYGA